MTALLLLLGSLVFSLAFNLSWAWGGPPLSVIAAGVCTLIVPAGLHLWPLVPAANAWIKLLRALVMAGICTAAAITSFAHAVSVLYAAGWADWTAWSVTGGVELLVALSTMALRQGPALAEEQAGQRTEQTPEQVPVQTRTGQEQGSEQVPDTPSRQAKKPPVQTGRKLSAVKPNRTAEDFLQWAAELDEPPSTYAVREQFKCGHNTAKSLLALLDDEAVKENTG